MPGGNDSDQATTQFDVPAAYSVSMSAPLHLALPCACRKSIGVEPLFLSYSRAYIYLAAREAYSCTKMSQENPVYSILLCKQCIYELSSLFVVMVLFVFISDVMMLFCHILYLSRAALSRRAALSPPPPLPVRPDLDQVQTFYRSSIMYECNVIDENICR